MAHGDPRPPPPPTEAREVKNEISPKVTEWPPHAIRGTTVALLVALMILKSSQALWSNSERFLFVSPQASVVVPRGGGGGRGSPWATASRWSQIANPSQVCPQSLPRASHLAILKHWLGSGSPSKLLCTCCPKAIQQGPAVLAGLVAWWCVWCLRP